MTTPRPNLSVNLRKELTLTGVPLIGGWFRAFGDLTLANASIRAEAKAILWTDLSTMLREGMSLEDALVVAGDRKNAKSPIPGYLPYIVFFLCMWFVYIYLLFPGFKNEPRVAAILARRLAKHTAKGLSLSQAMTRAKPDFSKEEVALVRMAEDAGLLPESLRRLAEFTRGDNNIAGQQYYFAYPALLLCMAISVASFVIIKIIPEFEDIFRQLGGELPYMTRLMIYWSNIATHSLIFAPILYFLMLHLILRFLLNGSRFDPVRAFLLYIYLLLFAIPVLTIVLVAFLIIFHFFPDGIDSLRYMFSGPSSEAANQVIEWIVPIILLPWILRLAERIHFMIDRLLQRCFAFFMEFFGYVQRQRAARWLAALDLAIRTHLPLPDALRFCGACAGGGLRRRSNRAALQAEKGAPIGDLVVRYRMLPQKAARQFSYFSEHGQLQQSLRPMAEDMANRAGEQRLRTIRVFAVASNLLIGVMVGLFCLSIYMVLFSIPTLVGKD